MNNRWVKLAAYAGGWVFLGLAMTAELYFNERADLIRAEFWDLLPAQLGRAAMWACLAPFVLRLRKKMPLSRGYWVGGTLFHVCFSFCFMAIYYLGRIFMNFWLYGESYRWFWKSAFDGFYGHNLIDIAYYWAILAFGYGLELYERFRSEELKAAQMESRLIETELKALREQLRPHFLFNTLNTVAVLVRERRNDEAISLLARLGSLLRMSLDPTRVHEVTLRQEMEFLERYVEIQKMRFSDRLSVKIDIDPKALDARIPNLLLQPIIENAIVHGASPKDGPCKVEVSGRIENGSLRLEVSDDGPGLPQGKPLREGIGLGNTRERLAKIYGAAGRLSLESEIGRGVCVSIILPCRP